MSDKRVASRKSNDSLELLSEIGALAHEYGVTSVRLQSYLESVAGALGFTGHFRVTPRSIVYVISEAGSHEQTIHYSQLPAPGFQLTRLARLSAIMDQFAAKELSIDETLQGIRSLKDQPDSFGPVAVGLAYAACGAGFAVLLSLAWTDVPLSVLGSLIVFLFVRLAAHVPAIGKRLEFICAFVVALGAYGLTLLIPGSNAAQVTLCSLINLVPGFGLTVGIAELAGGLITSGFERLSSAIMTSLKLFFGAVSGWFIVTALSTLPMPATTQMMDPIWLWVFMVVLVLGLAISFQAESKDLPWIVLSGLVTYAGMVVGGQLGFWQGSFLGAVALGLSAHFYSFWLRRPESIIINTVVMVLVPGAAALLGLQAGATSGLSGGLIAEWHTFLNIAAILGGLMVAYFVAPPKSRL